MTMNSIITSLYKQIDQLESNNHKKTVQVLDLKLDNNNLKKQLKELEHYRDKHILYLETDNE